MYLVHTEDAQSPQACIWRMLAPQAYRKVAPPLLRLWPENFSGEKPALERRDLSLAVKPLYVTNLVPLPDLYEKAGEAGEAPVREKRSFK